MEDFHYNYIKNRYVGKAEMLLRDNDSIIYEIETKNVYEDLEEELFDFSNYPKDSK